jgi:hypothetical protein
LCPLWTFTKFITDYPVSNAHFREKVNPLDRCVASGNALSLIAILCLTLLTATIIHCLLYKLYLFGLLILLMYFGLYYRVICIFLHLSFSVYIYIHIYLLSHFSFSKYLPVIGYIAVVKHFSKSNELNCRRRYSCLILKFSWKVCHIYGPWNVMPYVSVRMYRHLEDCATSIQSLKEKSPFHPGNESSICLVNVDRTVLSGILKDHNLNIHYHVNLKSRKIHYLQNCNLLYSLLY